MTLLFAFLLNAHATLTDSQKRAVIQAIEKGDFAILDQLSVDEEAKVIQARTLEIDEPGTYHFGGYDRVDISKRAQKRGLTIVCPTCPEGRTMYCR